MLFVRKATEEDLPKIRHIYRSAQDFMIASGNPTQWAHSYPTEEIIQEDVRDGWSYLLCDDAGIHGVFAMCEIEEPTYRVIEDGQWLNDEAYVAVHRVAGDGEVHGIVRCAIDYCKERFDNIRIDTHKDNAIMQRRLEQNGFVRCGTVYMEDGTPRIAYHWCRKEEAGAAKKMTVDYSMLCKQIKSLAQESAHFLPVLSNASALLFETLPELNWAGFYLVRDDELLLGPFQGKVACVRIAKGRGVCGTAWERNETLVVPDVHAFPGHIACDSASQSEIVIPIHSGEKIIGVLDVDSPVRNRFRREDEEGLRDYVRTLEACIESWRE